MSLIVVALGGNALVGDGAGTIRDQRRAIRRTAPHVADLADRGHDLVFTHGNGPQVGQLLLQAEETATVPARSLDVLVAETQAGIGYLLQQELGTALGETPVTVVTQTRVDPDDPALTDPTKPVGPFYGEEEAAGKPFPTKQVTGSDGGTAYRRIVPSPRPIGIVESDRIADLVATGRPVVCAGGGGVPVVEEDGALRGIEAVVDKDRVSQVLATGLGAEELLVLTDVDAAYRDFGTDDQERLAELTPGEATTLLEAGEFGAGSMAPKIESAAGFVERGGTRAIVTSIDRATEALTGAAGTTITR